MKIFTVKENYEDDYDNYQFSQSSVIISYHATEESANKKIKALLNAKIEQLVEFSKKALDQAYIVKQDDLLSRNKVLIRWGYRDDIPEEYPLYFIDSIEVEE